VCGLVAAVWRAPDPGHTEAVLRASEAMAARGPDADGLWESGHVSLGHRRLAILDPTHRSDQPMVSASGHYRIVFNGEIYNFRELKQLLAGGSRELSTTSDTEVLLALFEQRGEAMLPLLRGMFSLAIWDEREGRLFVARDPYGIKPLYVATTPSGVIVASTVRALQATGLVSQDPDPWGRATYWLTGTVAEPHTWFAAIKAFPPGHHAWIDRHGLGTPVPWRTVEDDFTRPSRTSRMQAEREVPEAIRDSVRAHDVSDVPVGLFLSGGIDSGVVGGLLSSLESKPVTAVTLKFAEFEGTPDDESVDAARIAHRYGIDHHVRVVSQSEFETDCKRILADMDQPSVDGVNTWFASKAMAELGLKVALSGVGGDELFQGYGHMQTVPRLVGAHAALGRVPGLAGAARAGARWQAGRSGNPRWAGVVESMRSLPGGWLARRGLFAESELPGLMGDDLAREALRGPGALEWIEGEFARLPRDPRVAMSLIESRMYLRNQLLRDGDWASMAHSVELRTPLVDTSLLSAVAPHLAHVRRYPGKQLLSDAIRPPLPESVRRRPKTGFGIPVRRWLGDAGEHPTRAWARRVADSYS
jgi:asparagine synthase (glutamine-hydrolysing)